MNIYRAKAIVSTILIVSGPITFATGAILYFVDYGMWLCFTRRFLNDTHAVSALIMGLALIPHLVFNRRIYKMEMKALISKKDNQDNSMWK
jgi:hypothetical protein